MTSWSELLSAVNALKVENRKRIVSDTDPYRPADSGNPPGQSAPREEIVTIRPTTYAAMSEFARYYRDGYPVIVDVSAMKEADARRVIDFASGAAIVMGGRIERVTAKVFLVTPSKHGIITTTEQNEYEARVDEFFENLEKTWADPTPPR